MDDCLRCFLGLTGLILLGCGSYLIKFGYEKANEKIKAENPCTASPNDELAPKFYCDNKCEREMGGWQCETAHYLPASFEGDSGLTTTCNCFYSVCGGCYDKLVQGQTVACALWKDGSCVMEGEGDPYSIEPLIGRFDFVLGIVLAVVGFCCASCLSCFCCCCCDVSPRKRPQLQYMSHAPLEGESGICESKWMACGRYVCSRNASGPQFTAPPPMSTYTRSGVPGSMPGSMPGSRPGLE
mmetsp:Transcript_139232/g.242328  ORF Transcript_139232/g.242328 Transcript_139232/m.242328 type:complete len:240 (+) Transcript_139232:65-784(+)